MVRTEKIRGLIAENGLTYKEVAKVLNITPKSLYNKLKKGVFLTTEVDGLVDILKIEDPRDIFFAKEVSCEETNGEKK